MAHEDALDFIRANRRGVLATRRQDGGVQMSPVVAAVDAEDRVVISTREGAIKTLNLRRDPHAGLCCFTDRFYGAWRQVEGPVEIVSLPEAMEPLVDYYRRSAGEHPDWEEYRHAMQRERRVLLRMTVERSGPTRSG
jgi:PPOX class probable F420-dependent enzyme